MWTTQRVLGSGAWANVYQVTHSQLKTSAAMKLFHKQCLKTSEAKLRVKEECDVLKKLKGASGVPLLIEISETEEFIAIVMELVEGGDLLRHLLSHGRMNEIEAKSIFTQVLNSVHAAHQKGFIHRDIKPENILLSRDKKIAKLTDWGFATSFVEGKSQKTFYGSVHYSSPEITLRKPYDGPEVDIWSLGVCLYAMTVGQFPFNGKDKNEIRHAICFASPVFPDFLSDDLVSLLKSMLLKDSKKRITLSQIFSHDWLN